MMRPITRQIIVVGLILVAMGAMYLKETEITFGIVGGLLALLKGEIRH